MSLVLCWSLNALAAPKALPVKATLESYIARFGPDYGTGRVSNMGDGHGYTWQASDTPPRIEDPSLVATLWVDGEGRVTKESITENMVRNIPDHLFPMRAFCMDRRNWLRVRTLGNHRGIDLVGGYHLVIVYQDNKRDLVTILELTYPKAGPPKASAPPPQPPTPDPFEFGR